MAGSIDNSFNTTKPDVKGKWHWLYQIFFRPRQVFSELSERDNAVWIKPMLVLTALVIVLALAGAPARTSQVQMNMSQPPDDFQYWTEEQQAQFFGSQAATQGPLFMIVFPMVGGVVSLWAGWFLLGSVLHLVMTFKGSRQPQVVYLNLVAWAALPFVLRSLVQIIATLTTRQVINAPGLSGFIPADAGRFLSYLRILLGMVDLYALGFLALMLIGAPILSGLKPGKARWMIIIAVAVFVVLASLPKFLLGQLGNIGNIQPFLFF